jgi:DNA-directed RNA polymerase specialized sigma24 family protein
VASNGPRDDGDLTVAEFLRDVWPDRDTAIRRIHGIVVPFAWADVRRRSGLGAADVDDVVMLVVERCAASDGALLHRAPPEAAIAAVLSRVLRFVVREWLRRARRAPIPVDGLDDRADARAVTTSTGFRPTEEELRALDRLAPGQREAVSCLVRTGSFERTAEELGISPAALRERLVRAVAHADGEPAQDRIRRLEVAEGREAGLSVRERLLVNLVEKGWSRERIANELRLRPESVRSAIRRLRMHLAELPREPVAPPPRVEPDK